MAISKLFGLLVSTIAAVKATGTHDTIEQRKRFNRLKELHDVIDTAKLPMNHMLQRPDNEDLDRMNEYIVFLEGLPANMLADYSPQIDNDLFNHGIRVGYGILESFDTLLNNLQADFYWGPMQTHALSKIKVAKNTLSKHRFLQRCDLLEESNFLLFVEWVQRYVTLRNEMVNSAVTTTREVRQKRANSVQQERANSVTRELVDRLSLITVTDPQTDSGSTEYMAMAPYSGPRGYLSEEPAAPRGEWTVGTYVEIFSRRQNSWAKGKIYRVSEDNQRVYVVYCWADGQERKKKLKRMDEKNLRPCAQPELLDPPTHIA